MEIGVFNKSKIKDVTRYGEAGAKVAGRPKGAVMTVTFELEGQEFMALNGGPVFKFSPAISLMVHCETQENWTSFGRSSPAAEKKVSADGLRTNTASHGKSFPLFWARCCRTRMPKGRKESWAHCFK